MVKCKNCNSTEYVTTMSGKHLKASCAKCGKYIKFLPQPIDWDTREVPIGKYKGQRYKDVAHIDPGYLRWQAENLKGRNQEIAEEAIFEFKI